MLMAPILRRLPGRLSLTLASLLATAMPAIAQPLATEVASGSYVAAELPRQLYGIWCERAADSDRCGSHTEIRPDGTVHTCASPIHGNDRPVRSISKVSISDRKMCFTITESDDPDGTPLGYDFCFEVQELNDTVARYILPKTGQTFRFDRLPPGSLACPTGAF